MGNRFENKVVVLTGAVGGLGIDWLKMFASEGALLAINHLDNDEFRQKTADIISELQQIRPGTYRGYGADVTSEEAISSMFARIHEDFGRIDVLVCGAGIMAPYTTWKLALEKWERTIDINLNGTFLCTKYAIPHMKEQGYGRIIYLSSVGGLSGIKANAAYCASKAAVIGLMKSVVKDTAKNGITVNCVAPGFISAGMMDGVDASYIDKELIPFIPMAKMGTSQDVANAIRFLASDDASYITGEVLRVDGGYSM